MSSRFGEDPFRIREPEETISRLKRFLSTHLDETHSKRLVVGMSGGLDSSVSATLCALAVGSRRVLGVCLPERETRNEKGIQDAKSVASKLRIPLRVIDITPIVQAYQSALQVNRSKRVAWGNVKARLRAAVQYYLANLEHGLVVGTGDKSEIMLGYFTKFGDGACDLQPLADLYKTSVRDLAKHLEIPDRIRLKPSSPELWPGQTAESELGLSYEKIDKILWGLERWLRPEEISEDTKLPLPLIRMIRDRWLRSEHKRGPPLVMKLGFRTAGADLRLPRPE